MPVKLKKSRDSSASGRSAALGGRSVVIPWALSVSWKVKTAISVETTPLTLPMPGPVSVDVAPVVRTE
jgi:hypothetical protein